MINSWSIRPVLFEEALRSFFLSFHLVELLDQVCFVGVQPVVRSIKKFSVIEFIKYSSTHLYSHEIYLNSKPKLFLKNSKSNDNVLLILHIKVTCVKLQGHGSFRGLSGFIYMLSNGMNFKLAHIKVHGTTRERM